MNHYIENSHRAYWRRTGAYDAFFRNRPTNKALELLKILTCVPVETVRARSRFAWKQAQRCVRPCGTLHPLGRVHATQAWSAHTSTHEHWHIHCSSRTPRSLAYTQHPDRASTHIAIAFTRHPTVATPTTIQLTPPKHTSHTHEQTEGRQTACAVVPSLSDTLADCATVATPFLGGKICHVHRPPRCEHASV